MNFQFYGFGSICFHTLKQKDKLMILLLPELNLKSLLIQRFKLEYI